VEFRWNDWNLGHATRHGVGVEECQRLVQLGRPRHMGNNKYRVQGRGVGGRLIQAIYVIDPGGTIYVIHARPLTDREKRRWRKRQK
jgi:uncharacterized DUF497 family protein